MKRTKIYWVLLGLGIVALTFVVNYLVVILMVLLNIGVFKMASRIVKQYPEGAWMWLIHGAVSLTAVGSFLGGYVLSLVIKKATITGEAMVLGQAGLIMCICAFAVCVLGMFFASQAPVPREQVD